MTAIIFDTLKFVETLKKSGIPENQAKAILKAFIYARTSAVLKTESDMLATKSDIRKIPHILREFEHRFVIKIGAMMTVFAGLVVTLGKII